MKRVGYLIEPIADIDNLRLAFLRAKRGKSTKEGVLNYQANLDANLLSLQEAILSGSVSVGNYHYFKIYDPKERLICASDFREQVLQHALMNVCHSYFERHQIYDSYASRINKGVHKAIEKARYNSGKYNWYLKLDFKKFFDNIHHDVMKSQLAKLFKDPKLLAIFYQIIDSYEVQPSRGVPIGNLTSQYFSNHYLSISDHYAKEKLQTKGYVRYMDDIVFWDREKKMLLEIGKNFEVFSKVYLRLSLKPYCLNDVKRGLPFLGYLIFPDKILLAQRSKKRYAKKLNGLQQEYESGIINEHEYQTRLNSLISFTEHANALGFRKKVMQQTINV